MIQIHHFLTYITTFYNFYNLMSTATGGPGGEARLTAAMALGPD